MAITIDKAIKRLDGLKEGCSGKELDPEREAIALGIEALKRLNDHRGEVYFRYDLPLPGETKE